MHSGLLKRKLKILLVAILCSVYVSGYADTQIGRYSTIANKPTASQVNPLLAVAQYKFPPRVESIGNAVNVVLQNTSYQLVPTDKLSRYVKETLTKPLPITDRTLGPMPIKDVLVILMGKDVFTLVVDPLHRLINFDVKFSIIKALSIADKKEVNKHA